ncbi:DUF6942 family protein [Thalassomonas sp. M1454]|uniref:DUF6942 family protein n=1 Tax=Thalassomonas sp. M1454 TaxID=2594477 RepID=UPI00117C0B00|nr:hypothetical protein [Thalassomonas sp. M1454]TRX56727.1 hypothetical protein FNN08_04140 [Thalassomonas sp. M1454]
MKTGAGLGSTDANIIVYIQNRPPLEQYLSLDIVKPMAQEEVADIARLTGNHWRKIFNVFAKLLFELKPKGFSRWQDLRDQYLLQQGCNEALMFSEPTAFVVDENSATSPEQDKNVISIIMGKTYAQQLLSKQADIALHWLNEDFAVSKYHRLIVCPYFDYRQLSNIKISKLVTIIQSLSKN